MTLSGFDTATVDSCIIAHMHLPLKTMWRPELAITVAALLRWNTFANSALHTTLLVDVISVVCNDLPKTRETQIQFYTMLHYDNIISLG